MQALRAEIAQLREAIVSRAVIEQAKGMLMLTHRITADQAFERLCRWSQTTNVKLSLVAQTVVETSTSSDPQPFPGAVVSPR